jgi:hypothetical protein
VQWGANLRARDFAKIGSMERDMDLVRQILLTLEKRTGLQNVEIEGYTAEQIGFHVWLMADAGLVRASAVTSQAAKVPYSIPFCITWQGYEFLAIMKDDSTWKKSKSTVLAKVGAVGFEIIKSVLTSEARRHLGLPG